MVMVVLQTGAEGRGHGQPLADIHRVIMFIVVAAVSELPIVGPVVLDQVDPQREDSERHPDRGGKA